MLPANESCDTCGGRDGREEMMETRSSGRWSGSGRVGGSFVLRAGKILWGDALAGGGVGSRRCIGLGYLVRNAGGGESRRLCCGYETRTVAFSARCFGVRMGRESASEAVEMLTSVENSWLPRPDALCASSMRLGIPARGKREYIFCGC